MVKIWFFMAEDHLIMITNLLYKKLVVEKYYKKSRLKNPYWTFVLLFWIRLKWFAFWRKMSCMFTSGNWYETGSCVNYRKYHHLDHQNCDIIYTNYIFPTYDDTEFIHAFLTDLKLQIRLFYVSQNIYIVYFFFNHIFSNKTAISLYIVVVIL